MAAKKEDAAKKSVAKKETDHVAELRKAIEAARKNGVTVKVRIVTVDENGVSTTEVV